MKKLFIFMMCLMLSFSLTGCGVVNKVKENTKEKIIEYEEIRAEEERKERFTEVYSGYNESIIIDKETRVQYLYCAARYGGGLTVLVGPDGKPLLYEGELE